MRLYLGQSGSLSVEGWSRLVSCQSEARMEDNVGTQSNPLRPTCRLPLA